MRHSIQERGQVAIITVMLFGAALMALTLGVLSPALRQIQTVRDFENSKQSYYAAEGAGEDAYYRIRNNIAVSFPYSLSLGGASATTSLSYISLTEQELLSEGNVKGLIRSSLKTLTIGDGFYFLYAVQGGVGGITMLNNAQVIGNVFSNGPILGASPNANSYSLVRGDVVSTGPNGSFSQTHATGSVYAYKIKDATIDKDAYYQTFDSATSTVIVSGSTCTSNSHCHPNSPNQATTSMPVSDALISQWESTAAAGGSVTCTGGTYTISSSVTIGPKKIPCNLVVSGNGTIVTLTGTIWVTGTISLSGSGGSGVQLKVSDTVGDKSVAVIADNTSNRTTSSTIFIDSNTYFYGSTGNAGSYVMLLSMNSSAENGGSTIAINVQNGATGNLLVYAPHGELYVQNNVSLREATAYKITLINNSIVTYNIGLSQALFTSGSGGAWKVKRWRETTDRP